MKQFVKQQKKGCCNTRFVESLIKNSARDYHQLMERTQKYIHQDNKRQAQKEKKRDEKRFQDGREVLGDRGRGLSGTREGQCKPMQVDVQLRDHSK